MKKCLVCNHKKVTLYFPKPGYVEIHHDELWTTCLKVIDEAVIDSGVGCNSIKGFGISCQRNTFITWKKSTGEPYHNFITWKDIRANSIVNEINSSAKLKLLRFFSKVIYTITRNKRFLAGSILKMSDNQIPARLVWVLRNLPAVSDDIKINDVAFGTIDTWLLYKLTDGLLHVTDISNASATGLFDPFTLSWADWAFQLYNIPRNIFPKVVDSAGKHFGFISEKICFPPVPIYSCMADQSASLFGSCCFKDGDIKVTMGTGTFLNMNTGKNPHSSFQGLYPLVGWKFQNELVYIAEGASNDTGVLIKWTQDLDILGDPSECSAVAQSVEDNGGVYFIPAFNGLQAPINDVKAAAGFIGLKPTTRSAHLLRAVLESIVFRVIQLFTIFKDEINTTFSSVKVDGGVSSNDFILQLLADFINVPVHRPSCVEMSAVGAAFLAGLIAEIWKDKEDLMAISKDIRTFLPQKHSLRCKKNDYETWSKAIKRFTDWYNFEL